MRAEHLNLILGDPSSWNEWRQHHPFVQPDLGGAELSGKSLRGLDLRHVCFRSANLRGTTLTGDGEGADFTDAKMTEATLGGQFEAAEFAGTDLSAAQLSTCHFNGSRFTHAVLCGANLSHANLRGSWLPYARMRKAQLQNTNLSWANFTGCDFTDATLKGADLSGSYLGHANLSRADLENARLSYAHLIGTDLRNARLIDCRVYGVSAWDVDLRGAVQRGLGITGPGDAVITVDNLEIAQFIGLLLSNQKIRDAIDAITSKVVLILGNFASPRRWILDAIRDALPSLGYVPVLFDFEAPQSRSTQETVTLLARMARFVIADITAPASVPQELLGRASVSCVGRTASEAQRRRKSVGRVAAQARSSGHPLDVFRLCRRAGAVKAAKRGACEARRGALTAPSTGTRSSAEGDDLRWATHTKYGRACWELSSHFPPYPFNRYYRADQDRGACTTTSDPIHGC